MAFQTAASTRVRNKAAIGLVLLLVLGACSGAASTTTTTTADVTETTGTETTATETTVTETTATETTPTETTVAAAPVQGISDDKVVTIGGWIAQSGPLAVVKNIKDAAQLAFDEANAAGGINGYTFNYIAIDDQADPSKTVTAAQQLWEEDQVFAVFLPYGSGANRAVKDYVLENDIPLLFPFADSRIFFPDDEPTPENVFGFLPPYGELVSHLVTSASASQPIATITVVHTNDDFGQTGPDSVAAMADSAGLEIVDDIGYDATETNFAPLGRRIADAGADATLLWGIPGSPQIIAAAEESGYEGLWLAHDGFRGGVYLETIQGIPSLANRVFINAYLTPQNVGDPDVDAFLDVYSENYPDDDPNLGHPGWVTAHIFLQAVEDATGGGEPLTWEGVREALLAFEDRDVDAAIGLTYTDDYHLGATKAIVRQFNGEEFETLGDFTALPSAP